MAICMQGVVGCGSAPSRQRTGIESFPQGGDERQLACAFPQASAQSDSTRRLVDYSEPNNRRGQGFRRASPLHPLFW